MKFNIAHLVMIVNGQHEGLSQATEVESARLKGIRVLVHTSRELQTRQQLLARSRYVLMKHCSRWTES